MVEQPPFVILQLLNPLKWLQTEPSVSNVLVTKNKVVSIKNQTYSKSYTGSGTNFTIEVDLRLSEIIPNLDDSANYVITVEILPGFGRSFSATIGSENGSYSNSEFSFSMSGAELSAAATNGTVQLDINSSPLDPNGLYSGSVGLKKIIVTQFIENTNVPIAMRDGETYFYGHNGMFRDDEIYGSGNSYTAKFWQYDSRLGRRWNVDPVVKPHESPYAAFANNPIWFIDPSGADTSFADNQARKDFDAAYKNVQNRIGELESEIEGYNNQLSNGDLNKRQTRKINKAKSAAEKSLTNWNKLKEDFDNIINDPNVMFNYSSNTDVLQANENGLTTGSISRNENGQIVSGTVNINIRSGHDEAVVHENRHGNQVLDGSNNSMSKFQLEKDAYIYQRVYNYQSTQQNIRNSRDAQYFYLREDQRPPNYNLDDMINFLYGTNGGE